MKIQCRVFLAIMLIEPISSFGAACPPPQSSIEPNLSVTVSYDQKRQLYKYKYSMRNGRGAQIPLDYFGFFLEEAPQSSSSPKNWSARALDYDTSPSVFRWSTAEVADSEKDVVTGDGFIPTPISAIRPGNTLSGFEIESPRKPGIVQFYAQGFTQVPSGVPTEDNPETPPQCPGWDFENDPLLSQVTGAVVGPSDPDIISVSLKARDERGNSKCRSIDAKNPSGKISIIVLSDKDFDASDVKIDTITFGPASARPLSSKLIDGQGMVKFDDDEEWDKQMKDRRYSDPEIEKRRPKNLMLVFDVESLDAQCNLDKSLFLRGETKTGKSILGAISAQYAGCDLKKPGRHRPHKNIFHWWKKKDKQRK